MKEKILELRNQGKSYNEISKILKCAKSTISHYCKNDKLISDVLSNEEKEILQLRIDGKTYKEIHEYFNSKISKYDIRNVCRENGLSYLSNKLCEEEIIEIRELYEKSKNVQEVRRKLGYSKETIKRYAIIETREKLTNEQLLSNRSKSVIYWRIKTKKKLVDYKGGKCEKCGYNKCIEALEFHHNDPNEKDFAISRKSYSYDRLKNEVDKCILVCSNCHREIHYELKGNN